MGEYFKNAHITIAASAASHAQDGILRARRGITQSVEEEYELTDGTICNIVIQERNHSYRKLESFVHDFGPLSKRGWAFQENVLSTRTIHYTASELVWECCTETISEDGSTLGRNQHSILAYNMQNLQPKPSSMWRDLVENYTRRDLTYPSDRLPGIAGIAQIMQNRTGFQYIAGLWKETLVLDLLWNTSWPHYNTTPVGLTGEASKPRYEDPPVTLRGPSWSWASTTAAIRFAPSGDVWHHDQHAMIKGINCKAEGDNLFGEVIHGSLRLVSLLRQLHFECSDPQNPDDYWIHTVHSDDKVERARFTPDKLLVGKEGTEEVRHPSKTANTYWNFH
ncbi:hypothetical protein H9L39_17216 [Fusarium oxysporum f. sp. albedinis]|nr:hypothetical protein H9L39_17216 [Fusarium oxysporum f. sp. albedinis]